MHQSISFRITVQFSVIVIAYFITVITVSSAACGRSRCSNTTRAASEWDSLMLSQSWLQTFCTLEEDNKVPCKIPPAVNDWTIHGLWPSNTLGTKQPVNCNNSWKFNFTEVKDLEGMLNLHWPNTLVNQSEDSLWKHEWKKHGTCAASLPALNTQHNYFNKTLSLQATYNLSKLLASAGIVPSADKQYEFDNVMNSLHEALQGLPQLQCYEPLENPKVFYIAEIRICMDKAFHISDCVKVAHKVKERPLKKGIGKRESVPCSNTKPLMIPLIQHMR